MLVVARVTEYQLTDVFADHLLAVSSALALETSAHWRQTALGVRGTQAFPPGKQKSCSIALLFPVQTNVVVSSRDARC